jgi:hypothetical protein
MTAAFTGLTLLLWGLQLLGIVAISNTVLGLFALITGILWLVSAAGVALPNIHR